MASARVVTGQPGCFNLRVYPDCSYRLLDICAATSWELCPGRVKAETLIAP